MYSARLPVAATALAFVGDRCLAECLRYTVNVPSIGCSKNWTATPYGINSTGNMGGRFACGFGMDHAFVAWSPDGPISPLNLTPSDFWSRANDINDLGQITGWMEIVGLGIRGFLYHNGQTIDLGSLAPSEPTITEALAINQAGMIVGYTSAPGGTANHAFLWANDDMIDLNLAVGPDNEARDINNTDQIVGWMGVAPGGSFFAEAFLWDNGTTTPLGKPHAATNSSAEAISDSGIVCGKFSIADPQGSGGYKSRALAWINGEMFDLGVLPGWLQSFARDVNDAGDITGFCTNPPLLGGGSRAFVWRNGTMIELSIVVAPGDNHDIRQAYGINNSGQIAADIYINGIPPSRAALLTPVPPNAGDTNCDWEANITDLLNVIASWGPYPPPPPGPIGPRHNGPGTPDLNDDGMVNIADILTVIQFWGS